MERGPIYTDQWGVRTLPQQPYATPCNGWPEVKAPFVANAREKQELQDQAEGTGPRITSVRKARLERKIENTTPLEERVLEYIQELMDAGRGVYVPRLRRVLDLYKQGLAGETSVQEQVRRTRRAILKELANGRYSRAYSKTVRAYDEESARLRAAGGDPWRGGSYY